MSEPLSVSRIKNKYLRRACCVVLLPIAVAMILIVTIPVWIAMPFTELREAYTKAWKGTQ